jgi:hypothetical protein
MTKQRKSSTILKPVIDEETAIRFASAGSLQASEPSTDSLPKSASKQPSAQKGSSAAMEKDMLQISFAISKRLFDRIAKEASRKDRTVEAHLIKHLTKHYDK